MFERNSDDRQQRKEEFVETKRLCFKQPSADSFRYLDNPHPVKNVSEEIITTSSERSVSGELSVESTQSLGANGVSSYCQYSNGQHEKRASQLHAPAPAPPPPAAPPAPTPAVPYPNYPPPYLPAPRTPATRVPLPPYYQYQ